MLVTSKKIKNKQLMMKHPFGKILTIRMLEFISRLLCHIVNMSNLAGLSTGFEVAGNNLKVAGE